MIKAKIFLDEEEYKPNREVKIKEKIKSKMIYKFLDKNTNSNKWTHWQNEKFLGFLKSKKELLQCPLKRKTSKIFVQISKTIKSRSPDQCRSHHQKMMKHHGSIDGIIENLMERLYGNHEFSKQTEFIEKEVSNELVDSTAVEEKMAFETNQNFDMLEEKDGQENIWDIFNENMWMYRLEEMMMDVSSTQSH